MKLPIRRRKDDGSLRPLTEKEIQKKLYGAYREEGENGPKEEIESIWAEPRPKEKGVVSSPKKKISFSFPWRKVILSLSKAFGASLKFSRKLLARIATGWGMSILVVALLFLGIHVLNLYRAKAMKAPPRPPMAASFPPVEKREELPKVPIVTEAPLPPVVKQPPSPPKPYVIQVCIYSSQTDAQRLVEKMKAAQLPVFVEPIGRANGKTFYPVFLGRFETFQEAQAKLKEFRARPVSKDFQDSFVRIL